MLIHYNSIALHNLINSLKSYKKDSFVDTGIKLLWKNYKKSCYQPLPAFYGFQILILGLLETSNNILLSDNLKILFTDNKFSSLCEDYLNLFPLDEPYLKQNQEEEFIEALKQDNLKQNKKKQNKTIPEKYIEKALKDNIITKIELIQLHKLTEIARSQQEPTSIELLYQCYAILDILNKDDIFKKMFLEKKNFLRSIIAIYTLALPKDGIIDFNSPIPIQPDVSKRLDIDKDNLCNVIRKISIAENDLREKWEQNKSPHSLQNFAIEYPVIEIEDKRFLIPCPTTYLRSTASYLMSAITLINHDSCNMHNKLGIAYQQHIQNALEYIFDKTNVTKIEYGTHGEECADFVITTKKCLLVIEIKKSFGYKNLYTTNFEALAAMYGTLYKAYAQCSNSISKLKPTTIKTIIPIIISAEESGIIHGSFQKFAEWSGIATDLKVNFIKIMSWSSLEHILSQTSVEKFIAALLKQKKKYDGTSTKFDTWDAINFPEYEIDTPAHKYEYLNKAKSDLEFIRAHKVNICDAERQHQNQ